VLRCHKRDRRWTGSPSAWSALPARSVLSSSFHLISAVFQTGLLASTGLTAEVGNEPVSRAGLGCRGDRRAEQGVPAVGDGPCGQEQGGLVAEGPGRVGCPGAVRCRGDQGYMPGGGRVAERGQGLTGVPEQYFQVPAPARCRAGSNAGLTSSTDRPA